MNGHGFWRNVGTGLLASFAGTVAYHVVAPLAGSDVALRGTIVLLAAIAALALPFGLARALFGMPARAGRLALAQRLQQAFAFQAAAEQGADQRVVVRREAQVELAADAGQRLLELARAPLQLLALELGRLDPRPGLGQLLVHLAQGLPQQDLGLFDAVDHRMQVGAEQAGDSIDQGHGTLHRCGVRAG